MALCNVSSESKNDKIKAMSDVWDYWISKKNITRRLTAENGGYMLDASTDLLKRTVEYNLELPWHVDSPLNDGHFRRIIVEIDALDSKLKGKFWNLPFVVPEGTSKQDPLGRKFQLELNKILNYERVNVNTMLTANAKIADLMTQAYISEHKVKGIGRKFVGNKALERLQEARRKMAEGDDSAVTQNTYENILSEIYNSDDGITVRQLIELVKMDNKTFNNAKKPDFRVDGELKTYNSFVYKAAKEARGLMNSMGDVYISGLGKLKSLIALKYTNTNNIQEAAGMSRKANKYFEIIDQAISEISKGKSKEADAGGYFPQVQFENIVQLKERLSKAMRSPKASRNIEFDNVINHVISSMDLKSLPAHTKKANPNVEKHWEKDPTLVLSEYANQAVGFNKMVHAQMTYLESLKSLPKTDMPWVKSLSTFMSEQYAVFTEGTSQRAPWVNNIVRSMNALQTARTMGLNITGAIKNAASALHFYNRVGYKTLADTVDAVNHDSDFQVKLRIAEKEAGFLFTDAAKELYTEGLITQKELDQGTVRFDPLTGKMSVNKNHLKNHLISKGEWILDKALAFHRVTENNQRKWMFRTAFHSKYKHLTENGYNEKHSTIFAKDFALKMVNGWAYEYAAHAKSKWVRGEWRTIEQMGDGVIASKLTKKNLGIAGGLSEMGLHLMHYPMSLMESQWSSIKQFQKSLLSKQEFSDSQEMQHMLRYAGVSGLIALSSILLNTDLFNILEDETRERAGRVVADLTKYDDPERGTFGLLSEVSGTGLGTLKYLAIAGGIIDLDHSTLNKIIFGNVDFANEDDRLVEMYSAYQYSTIWGTWKNKYKPALQSPGAGRNLMTHIFQLYPSNYTRKGREFIFGEKTKQKRKGKRMTDQQRIQQQALESLKYLFPES